MMNFLADEFWIVGALSVQMGDWNQKLGCGRLRHCFWSYHHYCEILFFAIAAFCDRYNHPAAEMLMASYFHGLAYRGKRLQKRRAIALEFSHPSVVFYL